MLDVFNLRLINPSDIDPSCPRKDRRFCALLWCSVVPMAYILINTKRAKGLGKVDVTPRFVRVCGQTRLPEYDRLDADQWMENAFSDRHVVAIALVRRLSLMRKHMAASGAELHQRLREQHQHIQPPGNELFFSGRQDPGQAPGYTDSTRGTPYAAAQARSTI